MCITCCKHDPTIRLWMSGNDMIPICSTKAWKITETTWESGPSKPPILWINGQPQGFCACSHVKDWRIRKSDSQRNTSPDTSRGSSGKESDNTSWVVLDPTFSWILFLLAAVLGSSSKSRWNWPLHLSRKPDSGYASHCRIWGKTTQQISSDTTLKL